MLPARLQSVVYTGLCSKNVGFVTLGTTYADDYVNIHKYYVCIGLAHYSPNLGGSHDPLIFRTSFATSIQ